MSAHTMTIGNRTRCRQHSAPNRRSSVALFVIAALIALVFASVLVSGVGVAQRALVAAAPEAEATIFNGLVSILSETGRAVLRYINALFSWLPK
jgi:hypothetical protein